jgi:hypothetical protein
MLTFKQVVMSKTVWVLGAAFILSALQKRWMLLDDATYHNIEMALLAAAGVARFLNTQGTPTK